jgi:hypothetical protein
MFRKVFFRIAAGILGILFLVVIGLGQGMPYKQRVWTILLAMFFILYSVFGENTEKILTYFFPADSPQKNQSEPDNHQSRTDENEDSRYIKR